MTLTRGDLRPEIIEVIDDDRDPFGEGASSQTLVDTGGPRYVGPIAIALLIAIIGYGVATSDANSDPPHAAPVTSTTVAAITRAPEPVVLNPKVPNPGITVPYYAAEPPRDFSVHYANVQQLDHAPFLGYAYELWATQGASATSGSWFAVTTYPGATPLNVPNAYRVATAESSIAISHLVGGQTTTRFNLDTRFGVAITSFGWTDDDLVRLAGSVDTDGHSIGFTDSWFTTDHEMLTSVQPWLAVQSIPGEQISYVSAIDPSLEVVLTVGKRLQTYEGGSLEERQTALRFLLDRNTPFEIDGLSAVAGTIVGGDGDAMATWIDDDNVVTVTAAMPLPELIAIARTVHQVSPAEWEGMKFQAMARQRTDTRAVVSNEPVSGVRISGIDADSNHWMIDVRMSDFGGQQQINWHWAGNGFVSTPSAAAQINTVVDEDHTYVLADLPWSIGATAQLKITRTGSDPVMVPFDGSTAGIDRLFAAYVFTEATPYTADIIDADGSVLASWPGS